VTSSARKFRAAIDPELKGWIDNCIVPALVDEYLRKKTIASESEPIVTSRPIVASPEVIR
jgi:hypothetical protein